MYDLMKKAKSLSRSDKIAFLEDIENLLHLAESPRKEVLRNLELDAIEDVNSDGFVDESKPKVPDRKRQNRSMDTKQNPDKKKSKYIPQNYTHLTQNRDSDAYGHEFMAENKDSIKVSKRLHDPETVQEMVDLLKLLEKNMSVDGDIAYDAISVFLVPLLRGSQRVGLKNNKVVGLMKALCRLSRKFQRIKKKQMAYRDKFEVRKDFNDCLKMIKTRLNVKASSYRPIQKTAQMQVNHRDALRVSIMNLKSMGLKPDEARKQIFYMASGLDYDVEPLIDSVISEVYS